MTILGLGTQILDCARVRKLIDKHGEKFLVTVFTTQEIEFCSSRTHSTEYYAAFWATKEAVFRSLGTKWRRGVSWHEVEIICRSSIQPMAILTGSMRSRMLEQHCETIRVSFAYSRLYATATAIAVG